MRFVLELASRYLTLETGRLIFEDEPEEPATEVRHVPMGFTAIKHDEGNEDAEEFDEAPEADCC